MTLIKLAELMDRSYVEAAKIRYGQLIPNEHLDTFVNHFPENRISASELVRLLEEHGRYDSINQYKLLDLLHEIKIQITFVHITQGQFNRSVYDKINAKGGSDQLITQDINLLLQFLSLTQDTVIKSRILLERIMNFIVYLETGIELGGGSRFSKKNKFYKCINDTSWKFFLVYKKFFEAYDGRFRTAEVHAGSFLKGHLAGRSLPDYEEIISLSDILINLFWPNLMQILQGRPATSWFCTKGMETLSGIKAEDIQPALGDQPTGTNQL